MWFWQKKKKKKKNPKNQSFNSGWAKPGWETGSDGDACSIPFLLPLAHHCSSHCLSMFKHQLCLLYFCKLRAHVCLGMESYPGEVFAKRVRQKAREDWAGRGGGGRGGLGGGLGGGGGGGGGGRDYTLTPAGCGDSPVERSQDRRRRTRKRDALAATLTAFFSFLFFPFSFPFFYEESDTWKPNENPLDSSRTSFFPGGSLRTRGEESEKRCRDECCAVPPAPEGPPLLIKGPKEDKKQRLSMIFSKKKTAKVERLVEGWWRDY